MSENLILENRQKTETEKKAKNAVNIEIKRDEIRKEIKEILDEINNKETREFYKEIALKNNPKMVERCRRFFARKDEVNPEKIRIGIEFVEDNKSAEIFRSALSFWSVPVSAGYGRRIRIIIWDKSHYKVFGVIGLCDPVIALKIRDEFIGWSKEVRHEKLYHMMSAYVLGAVPPYNELLGAKLVAMLAGCKEVCDYFREKYKGKRTIIRERIPMSELVAVDTMAFFGQSAIYHGLKEWKFVGYTQGITHFHLSMNGTWEKILNIARILNVRSLIRNKYGNGANWKFRVLRDVLSQLEINYEEVLKTGHKKGYYFRPLIENWKNFLCGKENIVTRNDTTMEEYFEMWKKKFLKKGITRWNS